MGRKKKNVEQQERIEQNPVGIDVSLTVGKIPEKEVQEEVKQEPTNDLVQPSNIDQLISGIFKDDEISKYIQRKIQEEVDKICKQHLFETSNKREKEINVVIKKPQLQKRIKKINTDIKIKQAIKSVKRINQPRPKNIPLMKKAKVKRLSGNSGSKLNLNLQISSNSFK